MGVNLQKSDCYCLDSERKKVLTSSPGPLACAYIHLGIFGSVGTHLPSVKLILPYFSSPRGVAVSVSFPEAQIRKETVSGLGHHHQDHTHYLRDCRNCEHQVNLEYVFQKHTFKCNQRCYASENITTLMKRDHPSHIRDHCNCEHRADLEYICQLHSFNM